VAEWLRGLPKEDLRQLRAKLYGREMRLLLPAYAEAVRAEEMDRAHRPDEDPERDAEIISCWGKDSSRRKSSGDAADPRFP